MGWVKICNAMASEGFCMETRVGACFQEKTACDGASASKMRIAAAEKKIPERICIIVIEIEAWGRYY